MLHRKIPLLQYIDFFGLKEPDVHEHKHNDEFIFEPAKASSWTCHNCSFINSVYNTTCVYCDFNWEGRRECPSDKWTCTECTFFNPKTLFYCEICSKSRPDLASVRF